MHSSSSLTEPCSSFTTTTTTITTHPNTITTENEHTVSFSADSHHPHPQPQHHPPHSQQQHPQATSANSNGSSTSSTQHRPTYFPIWLRLSRLIFGKIKRLPRSMSTTLTLYTCQMYLSIPVIIVCGATVDLKALLRPFRYIKEQGFLFEELGDQYCELL